MVEGKGGGNITSTLACPWHPDGYWRGCKRERVVGDRERDLVSIRLALVCLVRGWRRARQ